MFCNKCGKELKDGAKFCTECGNNVKYDNGIRNKKLLFITIAVIVIIAVVVGIIFIAKSSNRNEAQIDNIEQNKISANKELVRDDTTAPRDITYNFKLEDIKRAMDNTCKDLNINPYLDFEYVRSQNGVDFYEAYKDESKNNGCLVSVMVYNDYVINIRFIYYQDMIEQLTAGEYNVFFNILKENYSEDYSNNIKSILESLENEKYEYYENTICYKEIQDNFGTTEYSITASTFESYNELEGASSNDTTNNELEGASSNDTTNNGLNEQTTNTDNTSNELIKRTIEAYANLTTQYDVYNLRYAYYEKYARSQNGEDVYKITYLTGYTGFYYVRLVSLDSTNTMINKKTDLCKETLIGPQLIVETAYKQIWGNLNYSSNTNVNVNTEQPKKEMVKVPYFSLGNGLEHYTKELDNLGIPYKVVKGQDFDYEDNTVIKVEHNGENIEKGTTITITVADNQYKMNIYVNTEYLVSKAGLNSDNELKEVSLLIKINGKVVFNDTTPVENSMYDKLFGTYTGKPDNLNIEVTIEGKTMTLVRNVDFSYSDYYDNTPQIVINYFGGLG